MSTVFISHKKADEALAVSIGKLLEARGLKCWIDVLDKKISTVEDITKYIAKKIDDSSSILVVFTSNTQGSMWVPFELGIAYRAGKGLGTFLSGNPATPEYLDPFPKLRTESDLDMYAQEVKQETPLRKSLDERRVITAATGPSAYSEAFVTRLKKSLGQ